jgi:hypothetical protein
MRINFPEAACWDAFLRVSAIGEFWSYIAVVYRAHVTRYFTPNKVLEQ